MNTLADEEAKTKREDTEKLIKGVQTILGTLAYGDLPDIIKVKDEMDRTFEMVDNMTVRKDAYPTSDELISRNDGGTVSTWEHDRQWTTKYGGLHNDDFIIWRHKHVPIETTYIIISRRETRKYNARIQHIYLWPGYQVDEVLRALAEAQAEIDEL